MRRGSTPVIPGGTASRLRAAHAARRGYEEGLLAFVAALRGAGWPLQSIADAVGCSREVVRVWERKAAAVDVLPRVVVEVPPERGLPVEELRLEGVVLRRAEREERERRAVAAALPRLLELKGDAEALRGPSSSSPRLAAASRAYTELIDATLAEGVRVRVLAEALGVRPITITARLRRAGLRKPSPSQKVPQWAGAGWSGGAA